MQHVQAPENPTVGGAGKNPLSSLFGFGAIQREKGAGSPAAQVRRVFLLGELLNRGSEMSGYRQTEWRGRKGRSIKEEHPPSSLLRFPDFCRSTNDL